MTLWITKKLPTHPQKSLGFGVFRPLFLKKTFKMLCAWKSTCLAVTKWVKITEVMIFNCTNMGKAPFPKTSNEVGPWSKGAYIINPALKWNIDFLQQTINHDDCDEISIISACKPASHGEQLFQAQLCLIMGLSRWPNSKGGRQIGEIMWKIISFPRFLRICSRCLHVRISELRHSAANLYNCEWLASCNWWRKPEFPAKTTA